MERITARKPFQGITNILRFNWHFYVIALFAIVFLLAATLYLPTGLINVLLLVIVLATFSIILSLVASYYVYDHSALYTLDWLNDLPLKPGSMVNINAGFDETSDLLSEKFPGVSLKIFDFYDPAKHTEVSIERARKAYPAHPDTQTITTDTVPLPENSTDVIFLLLAAHEIRNTEERIHFFSQLHNVLKQDGKIVLVEHLRDLPNFLVYNIGFFHFHSRKEWLTTFTQSGFRKESETKITPFLSCFILTKNGNTP